MFKYLQGLAYLPITLILLCCTKGKGAVVLMVHTVHQLEEVHVIGMGELIIILTQTK